MALFSGKIENAYYISEDYSIVEVIYTGDDGSKIVHVLESDENHPDYKDLLAEGWTVDKIADSTAEYKRSRSLAFNTAVNSAAGTIVKEMLAKESEKLATLEQKALNKMNKLNSWEYDVQQKDAAVGTAAFEYILAKNSDKEELFKFKLWALEKDFVKSASKETKSKIRKVTKMSEGIALINELLE